MVAEIYATDSFPGHSFDLPLWQAEHVLSLLTIYFKSTSTVFKGNSVKILCSISTRPAMKITLQQLTFFLIGFSSFILPVVYSVHALASYLI